MTSRSNDLWMKDFPVDLELSPIWSPVHCRGMPSASKWLRLQAQVPKNLRP